MVLCLLSSVHRTSSRETIPLIHRDIKRLTATGKLPLSKKQLLDRRFWIRPNYHYPSMCVQKLMKIERGGCWGVIVTVFIRMWDSAIQVTLHITIKTKRLFTL
jgi:hypothetical protein